MFAIKTTTAALFAAACFMGSSHAATINISGDLASNFNVVVGVGNSANLTGDTKTFWHAGVYEQDIALNGNLFNIDTGNGNSQSYTGTITGPGNVNIHGRFEVDSSNPDALLGGSGANTMSSVTISQGTVRLDKTAGIDALAGSITYTGSSQGEISWIQSNQINDASTVDTTGGTGVFSLELNDQTETFASLMLKAGDIVETGASGVLTVSSLTVDGTSFGAGTYTSSSDFIIGDGSVVVVPEPGSLALLGLGGLMIARRRRG